AVELGAPVHRGHQRDPETALDRRRLLQLTVEDDTRTRWRGIEADPGEPAGPHRIVGRQPLYPEQVLGPLDRVRLEERRRADRGEVLTEQEVRAKTLPPTVSGADGGVDGTAVEIHHLVGHRDPHREIRVAQLEPPDPRAEP